MNKMKIIIFAGLTLVFFIVAGNVVFEKVLKQSNPTWFNSAEAMSLSSGDYIVGEQINPGFYDIKAVEGEVFFSPTRLTEGDQLKGIELIDESHVVIEGKGKLKLTPSVFGEVPKEGDVYTLKHSGYYIVGKQLPPGEYKVTYTSKGVAENEKPFLQILPGYRKDPADSFQFEKTESYNLNLNNREIVQFSKSFYEEHDHLVVHLEKE